MRRAVLYVDMFSAPAVAFPQHHFGSAPLALPRVKSESWKHVLLKNAPPFDAIHSVAMTRGAVNQVSRSADLNDLPWLRASCNFFSHGALPNYSSDLPSPARQAHSTASYAVGFFPDTAAGAIGN